MYRSSDGGLSWTAGSLFRGDSELLTVDAQHAWTTGCPNEACDTFGLLATADAGADWQRFDLPRELQPNMHGSRIYSFVTPTLGFVTASNEFTPASGFYKTTDGGRTFTAIQPVLVS